MADQRCPGSLEIALRHGDPVGRAEQNVPGRLGLVGDDGADGVEHGGALGLQPGDNTVHDDLRKQAQSRAAAMMAMTIQASRFGYKPVTGPP